MSALIYINSTDTASAKKGLQSGHVFFFSYLFMSALNYINSTDTASAKKGLQNGHVFFLNLSCLKKQKGVVK